LWEKIVKRNQSDYATRDPEKRRLRIYATDPMSGRRAPYRITIEIPNEIDLETGPRGQLVEVYDYDAWNERFYASVDLNERPLLMEAGLPQSESDPRFHQQMVYAVAMKVIDSAVRAHLAETSPCRAKGVRSGSSRMPSMAATPSSTQSSTPFSSATSRPT
jgi:hypothetical protein